MLPVSGLHFLVTLAYLILGMFGLKFLAVQFHDTSAGKALGFLTF
jgi:hypothetical protein